MTGSQPIRIVAVVQARMGSTRLPGKVLADVCGRSMLARVVDRVRRARRVDEVVVATGIGPDNDPILCECRRLAVACFRGDEHDVLDRYHRAAKTHSAGAVVRITSDCPLIDPEVIDRVVGEFQRELPDYAANTLTRTYPRGLDTEVISTDALARTWRDACEPYQRAHVTPYVYQHPELFRLLEVTADADRSAHRWTVDTPEDLNFVRAVYGRLDALGHFSRHDVYRLLDSDPSLAGINRDVHQKQLEEG